MLRNVYQREADVAIGATWYVFLLTDDMHLFIISRYYSFILNMFVLYSFIICRSVRMWKLFRVLVQGLLMQRMRVER
jgi:hypothetical protein